MTEVVDFPGQFKGKVAVVTGGTQGVGEATARLFARRGAAGLVVCGRSETQGEAVAAELGKQGTPTEYVNADLAKVEDCFRVVDAAERAFGRLDSLINCAGMTDRGTVDDTSPELWDKIFAVNVRAPFFLLQRAVKLMRKRKAEGTVVNVITMSSHGGQPFLTPYSASKGALLTLTRNTAQALLPERIRVNGLNIGWTDTPGEATIQMKFHGRGPDWLAEAEAKQPFGRLIKPAEVARAIAFLASPESGLMTGAIVDFDQTILGAYGNVPGAG